MYMNATREWVKNCARATLLKLSLSLIAAFHSKDFFNQKIKLFTWTSSGEASLPFSSSNKVSILSPLVARNLLRVLILTTCNFVIFFSK